MKKTPLSDLLPHRIAIALLNSALLACALSPVYSASAAESISCTTAVSEANKALHQLGVKPIQHEKELVQLLKILNRDDVLPSSYVTTAQAKEAGWSGKDNSSLWNSWSLNKKSIGGDSLENKTLPEKYHWYSADIEAVRGNRSPKRLAYSPETQTRYLTTDLYHSWVKISPCE
ncbi:ribonuclease [Ewingella americana]